MQKKEMSNKVFFERWVGTFFLTWCFRTVRRRGAGGCCLFLIYLRFFWPDETTESDTRKREAKLDPWLQRNTRELGDLEQSMRRKMDRRIQRKRTEQDKISKARAEERFDHWRQLNQALMLRKWRLLPQNRMQLQVARARTQRISINAPAHQQINTPPQDVMPVQLN
jgi:hypothetical protein